MVWAIIKQYAGFLFHKKRTLPQLREQLRTAMYTRELVKNGVTQRRGGGFVPDAEGRCEPAERLFRHCFESEGGGVQQAIDADPELCGPEGGDRSTIDNLLITEDVRKRGLTTWHRNAMRSMIKQQLRKEAAGSEADAQEQLLDLDEMDEA